MGIEDMSADQLRDELRKRDEKERTAPKRGTRKVTVDGVEVEVDLDALSSFDVLLLLADMNDEGVDDEKKVFAFARLCKAVMGDSMQAIVDHLGGARAQTVDVVAFTMEALKAAGEKN